MERQNYLKFFSLLAIAVAGGLIALGLSKQFDKTTTFFTSEQAPVSLAANYKMPPTALPDFRYSAEKTVHAVVHIKTSYQKQTATYQDFFGADPFQDFFFGNPFANPRMQQQPKAQQVQASGSGVIISEDGYIVTNNHVVAEADEIQVSLNDKRTYTAKIIGTDPSTDLALIKIEESALPFLIFGNSDSVVIGEWVLAVGNPFNLTSTVTAGIVSAKARNINILGGGTSIESFIQTDAAVNPGNSGGALVNTSGDLIGINAAIASNTGSYAGYSFAIPANIVKKVVDDLLKYGEAQRAFIGVSILDIDGNVAKEKGLKDVKGVYVQATTENGAAELAGVQKGDVILKIEDTEINSSAQLLEIVGQHRPGDKLNLTIVRDDKLLDIPVVLKNKYGDTGITKNTDENKGIYTALGATFEEISANEKNQLRIKSGIKVSELKPGKLSNIGMRKGFIITSIDKKPIQTVDDIRIALAGKSGGVLIEGVYPNGMRAYYGFGL